MNNLRQYGQAPFKLVVIHGGPGAPGYMAPVARTLSRDWSVLEPLQTATSLMGQVQELKEVMDRYAELPVYLIGSSWGAMLGFIFTAYCPEYVERLILVGSAVFEEKYEDDIMKTRLSRLNEKDRVEAYSLLDTLNNPFVSEKDAAFAKLAGLFTKSDSFYPLTLDLELLEVQYDLNQTVWHDAEELRASGKLLELGKKIECPVVAIHGDYDPHPAEGVQKPLSRILSNFEFILLRNCGHYPWIENEAQDKFYRILRDQLSL